MQNEPQSREPADFNGKRILVTGDEPGQQPRTYVRDLSGGKSTAITSAGVRASKVSPDSQSVVMMKAGKLYVHSLASGSGGDRPSRRPRHLDP